MGPSTCSTPTPGFSTSPFTGSRHSSLKFLQNKLFSYDHGKFYPSSTDADYDKVGEGDGAGFNVNIPWNGLAYGDPEYLMAFLNIILPIAYEFSPQLVLVSAGFDAGVGDPLSGYQVQEWEDHDPE